MDFWLQTEDLPRPENRIYYDGDRVVRDILEGNLEAASRLSKKLEGLLNAAGAHFMLLDGGCISARTSRSGALPARLAPAASEPTPGTRCLI